MVVRLVPVLALAALAGCGSQRAAAPAPQLPPGAIALPRLPAQGLVVEDATGVRLLGFDGHVYKHLAGFRRWPRNGGTHDFVIENLDQAGVTAQPRLVGPHDRWYALDAPGRRLVLLRTARITLPGGAALVAHPDISDDGGVGLAGFTVDRGGKALRRRDRNLQLVGGSLVLSRGELFDPATGESWRVARGCAPAGVRGGDVFEFCPVGPITRSGQRKAQLLRVSRSGGRAVLATLPLVAAWGALSPDGRYAAAQMPFACGATYAAVAPTGGGPTRLATGGVSIDAKDNGTPFSTVLGWTSDSKLIAFITGPSCEGRVRTGTYVIDPATLRRRLVVAKDAGVWNPFPG